ncbi:serine acetyltransferase [Paenibacillus taichungensis]
MIRDRKQYESYLNEDLAAHKLKKWKWYYRYSKPIVHYQRMLRKIEFYTNCKKSFFDKLYLKLLRHRFLNLGIELGFTISPNCFGPGLGIAHWGSVIVNGKARIGKKCRIHSDTNIGIYNGKCPRIGDHCYIGPGAKIYGDIVIGNNVTIGANSVVNKSFPDNVVIAGAPARIISEKNKNR